MKVRRACSIVFVATAALAVGCGDNAPPRASPAPVPADHPSVQLAARSNSADEFAGHANERNLAFACGEGGLSPQWQVCMLRADGVVAVVGFGNTSGIDVRLTGPSHDGVPVPLDRGVVYGVLEPNDGEVHLLIESRGREIGELAAEL